ncbi:ABC transporter permease [Dyella sp. M7H15-1]|uniref:ABC transporter permease n=1 Tax=Dyella sp. M7H15-1 TaxID=2501295 RepID=UPI0010051F37|nr:ABC transporter permease [Dyella sp. M7H15-1]QAU22741.1 ABC transporter permease [Dyella sp. M7H15-1]
MNAVSMTATPAQAQAGSMGFRRVLGAYLMEARSECLRYMRNPGFMLPITFLPTLLYLLFAIVMNRSAGADVGCYLLVSYSVFGVMSPGLFGFGVSLALERDGGLLIYKRALPMPPGAYLLGKMLMAMLVAPMVVLLLLAMGLGMDHVAITAGQVGLLLLMGVLGVLPFCALGMLMGTLIKGQAAPGMLNLIYLPMSFLSGLWVPINQLPKTLQQIAPIWPSYHLHELGLAALGMAHGGMSGHLLALLGFTVAFFVIAARRLRRYG